MPLVALSASSKPPTAPGGYAQVRINEAYVRALQLAGLTPLVVAPSLTADDARAIVAQTAGVVLSGGEDVDPARYQAARHAATEQPHLERDSAELALAIAARDAKRPLLGICRGLQLLNVALGGTLVQDLESMRPSGIAHAQDTARTQRVHDLSIAPESRLASVIGATRIGVNSLHHQAVDTLAPSLRATAHAPDGVIEAVESGDDWWVLAVQWHPEEMIGDAMPWDRAIFAAFAAACGNK